MPTTALTGTTVPSRYSQTGVALTLAAADVANGNHIASSRQIMVVAHNTNTTTAYTVSITSSAETNTGRTGSVAAQSLAVNEVRMFLLTPNGWNDTNDQYLLQASNAAVKFAWALL